MRQSSDVEKDIWEDKRELLIYLKDVKAMMKKVRKKGKILKNPKDSLHTLKSTSLEGFIYSLLRAIEKNTGIKEKLFFISFSKS